MRHVRDRLYRLYDGTGFRDKTLWDWMKLLMVPLVVGFLAAWFQVTTNKAAQEREDSRAALQLELTENLEKLQQDREDERARLQRESDDQRAQQSALQSYIRDMTQLLLDRGLSEPLPLTVERQQRMRHYLVNQSARANSLITVRQLDGKRKGLLLQFLFESNLLRYVECNDPDVPPTPQGKEICGENSPIPILMSGADLRGTELIDTHLFGAELEGTDLSDANLSLNNLESAYLLKTILKGANLSGTHLSGAYLVSADLSGANLSGAELNNASLNAVEVKAPEGTNLPPVFWDGANLSGTHLSGADLSNANLKGAKGLTNEQLAQAESLVGATLPDGTVIKTEEESEEFKRRYR